MPSLISIGILNTNTPQQNAGIFIGEINMTGWDANQKLSQGEGGIFGVLTTNVGNLNINFDGLQALDGNIVDQDIKAQVSSNT